jgi:hypothetical protein
VMSADECEGPDATGVSSSEGSRSSELSNSASLSWVIREGIIS